MSECRFCQIIEDIKSGKSEYLVSELRTGYILLGRHQLCHGYTLFLSKQHVTELHNFSDVDCQMFLQEMSVVAKAVWEAFKPVKLNYEMMGNSIAHAHWHIIPRHADDLNLHGPYWCIEKSVRESADTIPSADKLAELKAVLLHELQKLGVGLS